VLGRKINILKIRLLSSSASFKWFLRYFNGHVCNRKKSAFHSALGEEEQNAAVATFKRICDFCSFSGILVHEKCEQSVFTPQGHSMAWDCVVLHVELETKKACSTLVKKI